MSELPLASPRKAPSPAATAAVGLAILFIPPMGCISVPAVLIALVAALYFLLPIGLGVLLTFLVALPTLFGTGAALLAWLYMRPEKSAEHRRKAVFCVAALIVLGVIGSLWMLQTTLAE